MRFSPKTSPFILGEPMTREEIINRARQLALLEELHDLALPVDANNPFASDIRAMDREYKLAMDKVIRSRPWLYAHDLKTNITTASGDNLINLGYKYRYSIDDTVLDVIAINQNENERIRNVIPETREALRAGISYFPEIDGYPTENREDFVFVDGILHSDVIVRSAFVKKEIRPEQTPGSFQDYFCHVLAVPLARIFGESAAKARELEDLLPDLAMEAIRDEKAVARTNSHYRTILNWIDTSLSHLVTVGHWGGGRGTRK